MPLFAIDIDEAFRQARHDAMLIMLAHIIYLHYYLLLLMLPLRFFMLLR